MSPETAHAIEFLSLIAGLVFMASGAWLDLLTGGRYSDEPWRGAGEPGA